jgi:hypothetical protein
VKGKEEEKPTCSHCKKKGHEEATCWKLHPERLPKKFKDKGKQKATTIVQDLGSDSKVTTMGIKGIFFVASSSSHTSSSKANVIPDGRKRKELFHLRVISKHIRLIHLLIVDHK